MNPSTIFDIVMLVVACLIIVKFTIEGFFASLFGLCKGFLAIVIAYLMRFAIAKLFFSLFMQDVMILAVGKSLSLYKDQGITDIGIDIASLKENTPEFFEELLTGFGLDYPKFLSDFEEFFVKNNYSVQDSLADNVGSALAMLLSIVMALFVGLIIAYIVLSIVAHFLLKLTKFKGVKTANRWLGALIGVIIAFVVLWGSTLAVQLLVQFVGPVMPEYFNSSLIENSMIIGIFKYISPIELVKKLIY